MPREIKVMFDRFHKNRFSPAVILAVCYASLFGAFWAFFLPIIFANDHDDTYVRAIIILTFLALFFSALWGILTASFFRSLHNAKRCTKFIAGLLFCLFLYGVIYLYFDAYWLPVYLAGLSFPATFFLLSNRNRLNNTISATFLLLLAGFIFASLHPAIRVKRFSRELESGCWCCGYKNRAVRELLSLGSKGVSCLDAYVATQEDYSMASLHACIKRNLPENTPEHIQQFKDRIEELQEKKGITKN